MNLNKDLLNQLMADHEAGVVFGKDGVLAELTKTLVERVLNWRQYPCRSGADRQVSSAFPDFETTIISMYARGMTTREIQGAIQEIYGIEASPA